MLDDLSLQRHTFSMDKNKDKFNTCCECAEHTPERFVTVPQVFHLRDQSSGDIVYVGGSDKLYKYLQDNPNIRGH